MSICEVWYFKIISSHVDGILNEVPERSVARLVKELMLPKEKSLRAYDAIVSTNFIHPPVIACEWSFGSLVLGDKELMW